MKNGEKTVFVGGPIQHAMAKNEFDPQLKKLLKTVSKILKLKDYRVLSAHDEGYLDEPSFEVSSEAAVRRDFESIRNCDVYVCVLPEGAGSLPYRSDGCCVELGWASALNRQIILIGSSEVRYSQLIEGLAAICDMKFVDLEAFCSQPDLLFDALT
ncbi:MAG: nucleoside 2-deoxyribosyltransferase [Sulfitobacter sp.]